MSLSRQQFWEYHEFYRPDTDIKVPKKRFSGFSQIARDFGIDNRPFDYQVEDISEASEYASYWASIVKMPIDKLSASHHINRESARSIFKSIKEHGYDENKPIRALGDTYFGAQIINGHHRTIAARAAGYREIPVELISWDDFGRALDRTLSR